MLRQPAYSRPMARIATTHEQQRRLARLRTLVRGLDTAFRIPGTRIRFGWDSLIGLIPGIGDAATALISTLLIAEAAQLGASRWTLLRMGANVAVDAVLGSVPLVGDLFDVGWKANVRNLELLERSLHGRSAPRTST